MRARLGVLVAVVVALGCAMAAAPMLVATGCSRAPNQAAESLERPLIATQQAKLLASDGAMSDKLSSSVSVSGDTAVVGAYDENYRGAAYVFVRSGATWIQQAKLLPSDSAAGDRFGWSVSVSGDTAVVGAYAKNTVTGAAYVFVKSGTTWTEQAKLLASDGAKGDGLGESVSVAGDTAVVGAYGKNIVTGAAYVFVRSGATWTEQATLLPSDGAISDNFGWSASVSGDTAVVGAYEKDHGTGAAYVFVRGGATWTQQSRLLPGDGAAYDQFGYSVSISGDTGLVGAYGKNSATGAAYVFVRSGTSWTQQAKLLASDGGVDDWFGYSVSVSGDTAVVGAWHANSWAGAAYVFVGSGAAWSQPARLLASDGDASDRFGYSVSASGDTAVVGAMCAPRDFLTGCGPGAAYVFVITKGANGDPCTTAAECQSGFCVDGTCCADSCTTPCMSCANASGTCTSFIVAGQPDPASSPPCVAPSACDGAGNCVAPQTDAGQDSAHPDAQEDSAAGPDSGGDSQAPADGPPDSALQSDGGQALVIATCGGCAASTGPDGPRQALAPLVLWFVALPRRRRR
ncbi:MAG: FG-GAP repeat protein [Deltaproteobacteria bacterium]|nr:FG-GAP repeat protein [Deltaproteobacteria bacterium]